MSDTITEGKVVILHYILRNGAGETLDSTRGREPVALLLGAGNVVPGLEAALVGRARGERFAVVVPPAQGFGERKSKGAQAVPRSEFPRHITLEPGVQFKARGASGKEALLWVVKVIGGKVWVDTDHPLAGVELHFDAEVIDFRDPLLDELQHGHAHGAHGHDGH